MKSAALKRQIPDVAALRDLAQKCSVDSIERGKAWIVPQSFEWSDCCEPYKAIFRPTEGMPQLVLVHAVECRVGGDKYISARQARVVKLTKFRY